MSSRYDNMDCKCYIGDLSRDANERDIEKAFDYYGTIRSCWVARNPSGFGFVEFEDPRDCEDAIRGLDGTILCGSRIRVERATGRKRERVPFRGGFGRGRGRPFDPDDKCYECGERGHYAYDCTRGRFGSSRRRSRSRSRGRRRSYSRSRSRSPRRSRSYDRRSRSRSAGGGGGGDRNDRHSRSRSRSGSRN